MEPVGRHSPPLDGVTVANGHHLEPFALQPLQAALRGPVASWPQPADLGWWQRQRQAVSAHSDAYRVILAAVPVVLVNVVAFGAQLGFWSAHLHLVLEAVLVALALESIAVYLAWQAHLAQLADDSAMRLRLAAYGMALLIGALNYSHFDGPGWRPTVPAVTFGMMSAISPWLWSVHSRRVSRDALKARGLIEPHAVRLGATRLMWHPFRCVRVMSRATWTGENDPARAIALPPVEPLAGALEATQDDTSDSDTGDKDERQDRDDDCDTDSIDESRGERQDSDTDSDTEDRRPRQRGPSGSDKVRDVLKRYPSLRKRLLEGDTATRKAAKVETAQKAEVTVRTVERVLSEMSGAS